MDNFVFKCATEIVFGKDAHEKIGAYTRQYGKKVLLHYGGGSIKKTGLYDHVMKQLNDHGLEVFELSGVSPNPLLSLVYQGIDLCRKNGIEVILAVGGGSVIDSSKAIATGTKYDGDVWDFFCGKAQPKETLPLGCVLTIFGSGSESSKGCVITKDDGMLKKSSSYDINRPCFAIVNPEFQYTVSNYLLASGGVDIMSHVMERYFTPVGEVDFTDRLCEATLKTVIHSLPRALNSKNNYNALAELSWASSIAQNNLLATGRVPDMASHFIEHEVSGKYDVAHGAGLAAVTPAWMKYVYRRSPKKFVQFAERVWDIQAGGDAESAALAGIQALESFFKSIKMPLTLPELGIKDCTQADIEEMADKCTDYGSKSVGQYVKLDRQDVVSILNACAGRS